MNFKQQLDVLVF